MIQVKQKKRTKKSRNRRQKDKPPKGDARSARAKMIRTRFLR